MDRFEHAIELALDAFAIGHKGNFVRAIQSAQAAIPGYHRSRWLLTCAVSLYHSPQVPAILHIIRENLPLLPPDAI